MKLGVIRVLAKKIPALLKSLCKGGFARWGPWKKTVVAMSERARHMSRLSEASTVAPGYVFLTSILKGRWRCWLVLLSMSQLGGSALSQSLSLRAGVPWTPNVVGLRSDSDTTCLFLLCRASSTLA